MKQQKKLIIGLLLFFSTIILSGCFGGILFKKEFNTHLRMTLASEPSGAQIYLNGEYLGETPLKRFPVPFKYARTGQAEVAFLWSYEVYPQPENYYLSARKDGYYEIITKVDFDQNYARDNGKLDLVYQNYDFVFKPIRTEQLIETDSYLGTVKKYNQKRIYYYDPKRCRTLNRKPTRKEINIGIQEVYKNSKSAEVPRP